MTGEAKGSDDKADKDESERARKRSQRETPGWANGLRQLYDNVVNEPLPDNFKDLLSKLDDKN